MAFQKGQSGNPLGRKKGTPNKTTTEWRMTIQEILSANFSNSKISNVLKQLPAKHRFEIYFKLLEFILAKPVPGEFDESKETNSQFVADFIEKMNSFKNPNSQIGQKY